MKKSLVHNRQYKRSEIHAILGGGLQDYLPHKHGFVVCACFREDLNPEAPERVACGKGPRIQHWAQVFADQDEYVPVFIKKGTNVWVYCGNYRVVGFETNPSKLKAYAAKIGRKNITGILNLSKV